MTTSLRRDGRLMKPWFLYLLFGILPCHGTDAGILTRIVLFTNFQVEPPAAVVENMRDELAAIMSPIGFRFEWRSLTAAGGNAEEAEVAIVRFQGRCEISDTPPVLHDAKVLGITHVSDGIIIPFSEVYCDAVRVLLKKQLLMRPPENREKLLGRAVARVLAHELYHIFANTPKHASHGIAKPDYSAADLLSDDFQFEKRGLSSLRNGQNIANHTRKTRTAPVSHAK